MGERHVDLYINCCIPDVNVLNFRDDNHYRMDKGVTRILISSLSSLIISCVQHALYRERRFYFLPGMNHISGKEAFLHLPGKLVGSLKMHGNTP